VTKDEAITLILATDQSVEAIAQLLMQVREEAYDNGRRQGYEDGSWDANMDHEVYGGGY
jgi:hypothetical protein